MDNAAVITPQKSISKSRIAALCLGDVARGMIYGIITTYLLSFFVVTKADQDNGMVIYLASAGVTMAVIRAIGMLFDGISDPLVAAWSDRFKSKHGRRIPFMRLSAIPYGLFCMMIFFPPIAGESVWNAVWVGAALILYYTASTFYQIPFSALQAEVSVDPKKRSFLYLISAAIYVIASAMVYLTSMIKGLLITQGVEVVWAFRIPFFIFIAIGTLCALIASFSIKEKDYVVPKSCSFSMLKSMKETFRYRNFAVMAVGFLVMWISFGFFNASLVYDITVLLALPDIWMTIVPGISIVVTLIFYPIVGKIAKTFGKKIPLCVAMGIYALLYFGVYLCGVFNIAESPTSLKIVVAVIIGVCNGIPLAATNTIPPAAIADCAQVDTIASGNHREGMFMAVKNFCMKVTQSLVLLFAPIVIVIGATDGTTPTVFGVAIAALIASIAALVTIFIYAFYDDRQVKETIEGHLKETVIQESEKENEETSLV